jgi:hypothetical protein
MHACPDAKMLNGEQSQRQKICELHQHNLTWTSARDKGIDRQSSKDHSLPNAEIGVDAGAGVGAESDHSQNFVLVYKQNH